MGARLEREAAAQGKKPWEYQPWKDFAQSQELLAQGKPSTQKVTPRRDIYGTAVGQLPSGDWAFSTAFQKEADKFNQQYLIGKNGVLPLLNSAERLQQIIDKITVRDQNGNPVLGRDGKPQLDARKLTGADSIVGLLDAVGVSIIGTGGSARVTAPMIEGHEHARGWIEDLRALVQKYAAHGGPATPQQLRDYESVMSQALQTSYQNAIDAAGLMGPEGSSLGLDWLPKGHNQRINPNSAVDQAIVRIYAVGANQDPEGTVRAMEANGWNMN
jgi:hypothetical protein